MTIKKYLTTPEEILALKDTDTVIYDKYCDKTYLRFIDGVLCQFGSKDNRLIRYNITLNINENHYILVEEPVKEADENDIGKLCRFWNDNIDDFVVGVLYDISEEKRDNRTYAMDSFYDFSFRYKNYRRLTPAEVAEITGYKVEEN